MKPPLGWRSILALPALPIYLARPGQEADGAHLIQSRTLPDSAFMVFNAQHTIYHLARRRAATRFVFPNVAPAIKPAQEVLEQGVAAKPDLSVVGHLCPTTIAADAIARQAHYHPVSIVNTAGRPLVIYALAP